ncbi:hypothetical protein GY45DRAFT_1371357 [Cubamyces sp. BRFM 1775]|nr:hypothetical protein GY45DRAFT_1371357 [Cubamyces sp. BRFM 1775]
MPPRKKARTADATSRSSSTSVPNAGAPQDQTTSAPTTAVQGKPRRAKFVQLEMSWITVLLHARDLLILARATKSWPNLMFFGHCFGCLKPNASNAYWKLGIRFGIQQRAFLKAELDEFHRYWQNLVTMEEKLRFLEDCHEAIKERVEVGDPAFRLMRDPFCGSFLVIQDRLVDEG